MSDFANPGTSSIDQVFAQNAFVIGNQVYSNALNTSMWYTVIKRAPLPIGVGENLTSLIYDKSIPTTSSTDLATIGVSWTRVGAQITSSQNLNASTEGQPNQFTAGDTIGSTQGQSFIRWSKKLRPYFLETGRVKSPYVDIHDIRSAAALAKQSAAMIEALQRATVWTWERRYQESYERLTANFVSCRTTGTVVSTTVDIRTGAIDPVTGAAATQGTADNPFYQVPLTDLKLDTSGAANASIVPTAMISNKVLDKIYTRLKIVTPTSEAYGQDAGKPIFCLMIGDEASYAVQTEAGFKDDLRESSRVDDLLKPIGINTSFRGFYHMTLPDPPRFTITSGVLTRVEPLDARGNFNNAYEAAPIEAAYVVHKSVMESQVPPPNVAAPGFKFDPVNYAGEFNWLNIQDEVKNPLKTIGFFLGTFASANNPMKPEYGYTILFLRDTTPAA
jgi:hypothetical protein